jgi:hypothetical protein
VKDSTPGKLWKTMENYYGKLENCGKLWKPWPFSSMIFDDILMVYLLRMVSPYVKLPEAINGEGQ